MVLYFGRNYWSYDIASPSIIQKVILNYPIPVYWVSYIEELLEILKKIETFGSHTGFNSSLDEEIVLMNSGIHFTHGIRF